MLQFHVAMLFYCFAHTSTAISSLPESTSVHIGESHIRYRPYLISATTVHHTAARLRGYLNISDKVTAFHAPSSSAQTLTI